MAVSIIRQASHAFISFCGRMMGSQVMYVSDDENLGLFYFCVEMMVPLWLDLRAFW
jgi:hypothetical protein